MNDAPESTAGPVSLMVISAVFALACASAIGAVAALVVMTQDKPASATTALADTTLSAPSKTHKVVVHPVLAPQSADCVVAAWKTGTIYCFLDMPDEGNRPMRDGPAVVVQAQADKSAH